MQISEKNISIRKADGAHIGAISDLTFENKGKMLYRKPTAIRKLMKNYIVAVEENGEVAGCCGFKTYPGGDAEIISLAVQNKYRGSGIGGKLIKRTTRLALKRKTVKRVMAFTNPSVAPLFRRNSFVEAGVQLFHEKILDDCKKCPRNIMGKNNKYRCNEIAMLHVR